LCSRQKLFGLIYPDSSSEEPRALETPATVEPHLWDTLPPHFCIIFPANQVKVEILYVSSSFAFVCGSWFTQNDLITIPTQVVGGEKLKKTEKQKHECIKLWKCFKCFSFLSFSRALQSVSWPRAVKNRLDLLTRVANIQLSSTAVAYWLHIKKHLNRREGS